MFSQADGPNTVDAFHLPRQNEFIPKRLDVDKREVLQVTHLWLLGPSETYATFSSPNRVPI
jgi:hypothetical protein